MSSLLRMVWQPVLLTPEECARLRAWPGPWSPAMVTGPDGTSPTGAGNKRA